MKRRLRRAIKAPRPNAHRDRRRMNYILGFVFSVVAGLFSTIQGYQAITGNTITGNVVGTTVSSGAGGLAVIFGILILLGAFMMIVQETRRFSGMFVIILGVLSAIVTSGASLIPSVLSIIGGFFTIAVEAI